MEERQAAREERQAHLTALQQPAANLGPNNNNHNGNEDGGNQRSTLSDFQKTNPPTFSKGTHPLEADDWLRTIENDLEVASVGNNEKVSMQLTTSLGQQELGGKPLRHFSQPIRSLTGRTSRPVFARSTSLVD